jgi:hypothetical protein
VNHGPKMSSSKKLTCKGPLRQVLIRVYRLVIQSGILIFRPSFMNCCPSNFLSGSSLPPPPLPCVIKYTARIQCVRGGIGSGPQTDKHLPQSPFAGQFFRKTTFFFAFYESYLSTGYLRGSNIVIGGGGGQKGIPCGKKYEGFF